MSSDPSSPSTGEKYAVIKALRATASIIWQEADRYTKARLVGSFGLLVIGSVLGALVPVIYKLIIDVFSGAAPPTALFTPAALIAAYVMCIYVINSSGALRQLVHGLGTQRLNRRLSNRLFGHIVRLPLRFHLDRKTGAIGETLGQGLSGCQIVLQHAVFTFLPVIVEFIAIVVVLIHFQHSAYLLLIGVSAVAYGYTFWRFAEQTTAPARRVSDTQVNCNATLTDSLLNYETIKYFAGEPRICTRFDKALIEREGAWRGLMRLNARNGVILETIYAVSIAASLAYAGYEVLHGTMTVGDFVLINTYVGRLYQPLEAMGMAARDISQGLAFLQKMLDMFREKAEGDEEGSTENAHVPATTEFTAGMALDAVGGELTFEHVSFSYKADRQILHDISFHVPSGHTLGIVGVSGSGKSSLIRLLFRLYEPTDGSILLDGTPTSKLPISVLRNSIAVVPQDTVLFNDTIGQNIAFGRQDATQQDIESAAKLAHMHDFIASLPDGYDTAVGERGLKLSGGEKQRVAIARAALKKPRIFVFDEATSSLDSKAEREILHNLIEVSQNCTTVVIAHRLSTVVHADEIVVLERGILVERGTHAQLLEANGSYASLWKAQQGGRKEALEVVQSVA